MPPSVIQQRCFNHAGREAVALCPECDRTYCRECVTEHGDRVLCATCLETVAAHGPTAKRFLWAGLFFQGLVAVAVLWLLFYGLGTGLMALPSEFHDTSLWLGSIESVE